MQVLFFSRDESLVDQLVLAFRMRWPNVESIITTSIDDLTGSMDDTDLVVVCDDLSELEMCSSIKNIRSRSDVPLIVTSNGASEVEVVRALELGADDYIRMPCSLMEVVARAMAILRRTRQRMVPNGQGTITCGDLAINAGSHEAFLKDEPLLLTPTEFRLLYLLAKNRHVILSQRFIQSVIWAEDVESNEALKKYIQRLRRKLGDDARNPTWIETVHGIGYRFAAPVSSAA